MSVFYALKFFLIIKKTNISAQKIDNWALANYKVIIAGFLL